VNALANLPTRKRIAEPSFKWLPIDAFEWLTQEQKETYLFEITKQLGLHPCATSKTSPISRSHSIQPFSHCVEGVRSQHSV